jgi:hypothetical protein
MKKMGRLCPSACYMLLKAVENFRLNSVLDVYTKSFLWPASLKPSPQFMRYSSTHYFLRNGSCYFQYGWFLNYTLCVNIKCEITIREFIIHFLFADQIILHFLTFFGRRMIFWLGDQVLKENFTICVNKSFQTCSHLSMEIKFANS